VNDVIFQDWSHAIHGAGKCSPRVAYDARALRQTQEDLQLATVHRAFDLAGGFETGDEVALRLRGHSAQPISMLARWIVNREVISFQSHLQTMLPLFQFDPATMTMQPKVSAIIGELRDVFNDWELALWFAEPNAWLDDRAPVEVCALDSWAALRAARADRFVARG
jgi:hypothetical protein